MSATNRPRTLYPFYAWLALFYLAWLVLVLAGGFLHTVLAHWPMALAMAAGSYVAGSTPMGGGTVGFPVLVLLMDLPATLGRDFSLAIQSVGMTSASIYIFCRRQELEWPMLRAALPGGRRAEVWLGRLAADGRAAAWDPAFDVTPAKYIAGIVTDKGVARPPYTASLAALFRS